MTALADIKKYIFLLGGMDLEMKTIAKLLKKNNLAYHDKHLKWGAKLSSYQQTFNDFNVFVGVELEQDVDPPIHYINIDHHNEHADLPCSLQQVAELLGKKLTSFQKLICANDSGYIPAMETAGATPKQVMRIRKADRKAQGVTELEEILGKEAIERGMAVFGEFKTVYTLGTKFSPIVDLLYPYSQLLVYNACELTYFGRDALKIVEYIRQKYPVDWFFSGGGVHGFFGLKHKVLQNQQLFDFKDKLQTLIITKEYYGTF